jgi:hypothetical protein
LATKKRKRPLSRTADAIRKRRARADGRIAPYQKKPPRSLRDRIAEREKAQATAEASLTALEPESADWLRELACLCMTKLALLQYRQSLADGQGELPF